MQRLPWITIHRLDTQRRFSRSWAAFAASGGCGGTLLSRCMDTATIAQTAENGNARGMRHFAFSGIG